MCLAAIRKTLLKKINNKGKAQPICTLNHILWIYIYRFVICLTPSIRSIRSKPRAPFPIVCAQRWINPLSKRPSQTHHDTQHELKNPFLLLLFFVSFLSFFLYFHLTFSVKTLFVCVSKLNQNSRKWWVHNILVLNLMHINFQWRIYSNNIHCVNQRHKHTHSPRWNEVSLVNQIVSLTAHFIILLNSYKCIWRFEATLTHPDRQ